MNLNGSPVYRLIFKNLSRTVDGRAATRILYCRYVFEVLCASLSAPIVTGPYARGITWQHLDI